MIPLRDNIPTRHYPVITRLIVGINVVVFLFERQLSPEKMNALSYLFGIVPARFSHPAWAAHIGLPIHEYWPFLTSMFLHAGWLHLIGNMWFLWILGDKVEEVMGRVRFALFYVLCGVLSGVVHFVTNPASTVPTVGASGAIAGVLGAYFALYPLARVLVVIPIFFFPFFFELPAIIFIGLWFLIQFFSGTVAVLEGSQMGGVAWWAHIGGFLAGLVLYRSFLLDPAVPTRPAEQPEHSR